MDNGSLVLSGGHWVACLLPCCDVLTCSWSCALRRVSGSTVFPWRPEVLAGLLTPVIPSQLPSISQLSPSSVEGFLFLSVLLPSLVLYLLTSLWGVGWEPFSVISSRTSCLLLSFLVEGCRSSLCSFRNIIILIKWVGIQAVSPWRKPPHKIKPLVPALPGFWEHKSLSILISNFSSHSPPTSTKGTTTPQRCHYGKDGRHLRLVGPRLKFTYNQEAFYNNPLTIKCDCVYREIGLAES